MEFPKSLDFEDKKKFCQEIGIAVGTLTRALNYINDKQADPDAVEGFSAGGGSGDSGRQKIDTPTRATEIASLQFNTNREYITKAKKLKESIRWN